MKTIFTLAAVFFGTIALSQSPEKGLTGRVEGLNITEANPKSKNISLRCKSTLIADSPVLVVDGLIKDLGTLSSLNPNDIEKVEVLKSAAATALYGSKALAGVIIVTTKASAFISVKSTADSSAIPFATIKLQDGQKTMTLAADQFGRISKTQIAEFDSCMISISSVSYIPQVFKWKSGDAQPTFFLEPEYKGDNVFVYATVCRTKRICRYYCGVSRCTNITLITEKKEENVQPSFNTFKFYPNPIQNGRTGYLQIDDMGISTVELYNMSGQIMWQQQVGSFIKNNPLHIPISNQWKPGMYILKTKGANNVSYSTKVIIQ